MLKPYLNIIIGCLWCFLFFTEVQAAPQAKIAAPPAWLIKRNPDLSKQPKAQEIENGEYVVLYDEQVNVQAKARYFKISKKIINESGVQSNSELSFNFSAAYQQIVFHEMSILRDGEKINKLQLSNIKIINNESSLYNHQLNGRYNALIILDDLRKGDVLEYAYSIIGENPIYGNVYEDAFTFASYNPIMNYYTSVIAPSNRTLQIKAYNKAANPNKSILQGNTVYDWPVMELKPYEFGGNPPSWFRAYPYVEITEYTSWKGVNDWALGLVNNYNYKLPAGLIEKINKWQADADGNMFVFAKLATQFVQDDIRYMGIEIGENSHKPHEPSETYNKRYGDCKDKSILLVTILRYANLQAYSALVSTDLKAYIDEHLPGANAFDHVIVKTIIEGKTIFVDPTIPLQRGQFFEQQLPAYEKALVISPTTKFPEKIALQNRGSISISEIFDVPENNNSMGKLEVATTYKYADADDMRYTLNNSSLKSIAEDYENYYRNIFQYAKKADTIAYHDDTELNILTVNETYLIDSIWEKTDEYDFVRASAKPIYERMTAPDDKVTDKPLTQKYPIDITYTATYKMATEWSFEDKGFNIVRSSYSFNFKPTVVGSTVILEYSFKTFKDHIPVNELGQYKKDYERIKEALDYVLTNNTKLQKNLDNINSKGITAKTNWIAVFLSIITLIGAFLILRRINKTDTELTSHTDIPETYSWWLIFLGIVIAVRICLYLYSVIWGGYLSSASWLTMSELGETRLQLILMIEMIFVNICFIYSCWLMFWFVKRRDIFPKMFILLALAELGINLLTFITGLVFKTEFDRISYDLADEGGKATVKSIVFVAIWVSAVHLSPVVKRIFIVPYRYIYPNNNNVISDVNNTITQHEHAEGQDHLQIDQDT